MHVRRYVCPVAVAGLLMATALILLLNNSRNQAVTADIVNTPTPAVPGVVSTPPPATERAAFVVTPPSLVGKVLHWTPTEYHYAARSPDPGNGRAVTGDIWVQMGPDGVPTLFHGRYTYADGSFRQEIVQTPHAESVTFETAMVPTTPVGRADCTQRAGSTPDRMRGLVPQFIDETALPRFGFRATGGGPPAKPLPVTTSVPGVAPRLIYDGGTIRRWEERLAGTGGTGEMLTLEIGTEGRLRVRLSQLVDAQGQVVNEDWTAYGPLEVYDAGAIPASVFALSQEGCHG